MPDFDAVIDKVDRRLTFESQSGFREFDSKTLFINCFEHPRTKLTMHSNRRANYRLGDSIDVHSALAAFSAGILHREI